MKKILISLILLTSLGAFAVPKPIRVLNFDGEIISVFYPNSMYRQLEGTALDIRNFEADEGTITAGTGYKLSEVNADPTLTAAGVINLSGSCKKVSVDTEYYGFLSSLTAIIPGPNPAQELNSLTTSDSGPNSHIGTACDLDIELFGYYVEVQPTATINTVLNTVTFLFESWSLVVTNKGSFTPIHGEDQQINISLSAEGSNALGCASIFSGSNTAATIAGLTTTVGVKSAQTAVGVRFNLSGYRVDTEPAASAKPVYSSGVFASWNVTISERGDFTPLENKSQNFTAYINYNESDSGHPDTRTYGLVDALGYKLESITASGFLCTTATPTLTFKTPSVSLDGSNSASATSVAFTAPAVSVKPTIIEMGRATGNADQRKSFTIKMRRSAVFSAFDEKAELLEYLQEEWE